MKIDVINQYSFKFEDIDVIYPTYIYSDKKREYYNFKKIISTTGYSRSHQLNHRSTQAKLFDLLIDINYFNIEIIKEMVLINTKPDIDNSRSYYLLDYFIPSKSLCIELDSDYHDPIRDNLKDQFLNSIGIEVLRVKDFQSNTKFKLDKIVEWIKSKPIKEFSIKYSKLIEDSKSRAKEITNLGIPEYLWNIKDMYKHKLIKLNGLFPNIENAILSKTELNLIIPLDEIWKILPMSEKKVKSYYPLINYLKTLGIELMIRSKDTRFKIKSLRANELYSLQ